MVSSWRAVSIRAPPLATSFSGVSAAAPPPRKLRRACAARRAWCGAWVIDSVLCRGLKYLSTGEIRKVLLCRELLREPAWLVFDEPYEGLDSATRLVLAQELDRLVSTLAFE